MHTVDYFYSAHSAFAYLGHERLLELCAAHDCRLIHRPFLLSPAMEAAGGVPFAQRSNAHEAYFFGLEIARWSRVRNVPIMEGRPTFHDNSYDLANRLLIAAADGGLDVDGLALAIFKAHWIEDVDFSDEGQLCAIVESVGLEVADLLGRAHSPHVKAQHRSNLDEAIRRNVFGSPTYFLDGEMFYGQDRLEMMELRLTGKLDAD